MALSFAIYSAGATETIMQDGAAETSLQEDSTAETNLQDSGAAETSVQDDSSAAENVETSETETEQERLYCVGSVSKTYVAAAVMQLVDQGKVDLDAPVTDYIPDFKMADERYKDITVRMLMNHTSGIMGTTLLNESLYDDCAIDADRILLENLTTQRLKADPGEYAAYCNDGFGLLQIIVENVSDMSYTDYITNELAGKLGLSHTGTPMNAASLGAFAPVYVNKLPYDPEYCLDIGSGGIYATASDVAQFGSSFFAGSEKLISQKLVDEMEKKWSDSEDEYQDGCGLGWDYVKKLQYDKAGVQIVGKGGDVGTMHAHLMVAPENEISVSVLSSGGSSSYCMLMCEELLNAALKEQGIEVEELQPEEVQIGGTIPEAYQQYAGYYSFFAQAGSGLAKISFPDDMSMLVELTTVDGRTTESYYRYTDGDGFAEVTENGLLKTNRNVLFFEQKDDGKVYIKCRQYTKVPQMGVTTRNTYIGERLEENPVSEEVQKAWEAYCEVPFATYNNRYSSTVYDSPFVFTKLPKDLPGYVLAGTGLGYRLLKIEDEKKAVSFQTMPCSTNRDLIDLRIKEDGTLDVSTGNSYVPLSAVPEFTSQVTEVNLTSDQASWYRISDEMAYEVITANYPDDAQIYVYNKFFEPVYTTHYTQAREEINLPEGGYIVFLGQSGETVAIQ